MAEEHGEEGGGRPFLLAVQQEKIKVWDGWEDGDYIYLCIYALFDFYLFVLFIID